MLAATSRHDNISHTTDAGRVSYSTGVKYGPLRYQIGEREMESKRQTVMRFDKVAKHF